MDEYEIFVLSELHLESTEEAVGSAPAPNLTTQRYEALGARPRVPSSQSTTLSQRSSTLNGRNATQPESAAGSAPNLTSQQYEALGAKPKEPTTMPRRSASTSCFFRRSSSRRVSFNSSDSSTSTQTLLVMKLEEQDEWKDLINNEISELIRCICYAHRKDDRFLTLNLTPGPYNGMLGNSLFAAIEAIFLHGMKGHFPSYEEHEFWNFLTASRIDRRYIDEILAMKLITTNIGKCSAWIRHTAAVGAFEKEFNVIVADKADVIERYYEPWSFMRDGSQVMRLRKSLEGLQDIRFQLNANAAHLNRWSKRTLCVGNLLSLEELIAKRIPVSAAQKEACSFPADYFDQTESEENGVWFSANSAVPSGATSSSVEIKGPAVKPGLQRSSSVVERNNGSPWLSAYSAPTRLSATELSTNFNQTEQRALGSELSAFKMQDRGTLIKNNMPRSPMRHALYHETYGVSTNTRYKIYYQQDPDSLRISCMTVLWDKDAEDIVTCNRFETSYCHQCQPSNAEESTDAVSASILHDDKLRVDAGTQTDLLVLGFKKTPEGRRADLLRRFNKMTTDEEVPMLANMFYRKRDPELGYITFTIVLELMSQSSSYPTVRSVNVDVEADHQELNPTLSNALNRLFDGGAGATSNPDPCVEFQLLRLARHIEVDEGPPSSITVRCQNRSLQGLWDYSDGYEPHKPLPEDIQFLQIMEGASPTPRRKDICHSCLQCIPNKRDQDQMKLCHYDKQYHCKKCHKNNKRLIPGEMIQYERYSEYPVCEKCRDFLTRIECKPLIHLYHMNKHVYGCQLKLKKIKILRKRLSALYDYLQSCQKAKSLFNELDDCGRLRYISKQTDVYSIKDLRDAECGKLEKRLQKLYDAGYKHVINCLICYAKGYICSICANDPRKRYYSPTNTYRIRPSMYIPGEPEIIFPMDVESTTRCKSCGNTYHRICKMREPDRCRRCESRKKYMKLPLPNVSSSTVEISESTNQNDPAAGSTNQNSVAGGSINETGPAAESTYQTDPAAGSTNQTDPAAGSTNRIVAAASNNETAAASYLGSINDILAAAGASDSIANLFYQVLGPEYDSNKILIKDVCAYMGRSRMVVESPTKKELCSIL